MADKKKEQAMVVSQEQIADGIFSMWIHTEAAQSARPGQFISMYTKDATKLLPRPISICEINKEDSRLRVVYRVTGENTGTEEFSKLKTRSSDLLEMDFRLKRLKERKYFLWVEELVYHRFWNLQNR